MYLVFQTGNAPHTFFTLFSLVNRSTSRDEGIIEKITNQGNITQSDNRVSFKFRQTLPCSFVQLINTCSLDELPVLTTDADLTTQQYIDCCLRKWNAEAADTTITNDSTVDFDISAFQSF